MKDRDSPQRLLRELRQFAVLRLKLVNDQPTALVMQPSGAMSMLPVGSRAWFAWHLQWRVELGKKAPSVEAQVGLVRLLNDLAKSPEFSDGAPIGEMVGKFNADRAVLESALVPEKHPVEPCLSDLVPSVRPRYVPQRIGALDDLRVMGRALQARQNLLLVGPPGSGKSLSLRALAFEQKLPIFSVDLHDGFDTDDAVGKFVRSDGDWLWRDGKLLGLVKNGGLFVAEEVDSARDTTLSRFHSLLASRSLTVPEHEGETITAHPNFGFVATTNDASRLPPRFRERFTILRYAYDTDVEASLCPDVRLRAVFAELRREPRITTDVSTRKLVAVTNSVATFGTPTALALFLNQFKPSEQPLVEAVMVRALQRGREAETEPIELTQ